MSRPIPPIHAGDSLLIEVTVREGGAPMNLAGATVAAAASSITGASVAIAAAFTDAAAGQFTLSIPAGLIGEGVYNIQARVALPSGEAQTVIAQQLTVQRSVL